MAQFLPITLLKGNLGQRHRDLNSHVKQAATSQVSFQDIAALPEHAPIDRLFKIDLANKVQDLDYILQNVKDDDMLYVSRALKCKWLLERRDEINPKYLENVLFPEMVMPAISKMKHWLYINLRDPVMCQEFYQYYKDSKFEFAVKFLSHCDDEYIVNEFPNILSKITPHYLKVFAEKNHKLVKVYFDTLLTDHELVKRYLKDEKYFYNNIKCVLKSDPDIFLDITEKYHSLSSSDKLSAAATDYILCYCKNRFLAKSELYIVYLLDMSTVAKRLSVEECKDVVMKLARADYLSWWFSYDKVEPLVKRVNRDSRAAFKKQVFVEKKVGEHVTEWPYPLPASPTANEFFSGKTHLFSDHICEPIQTIPRCFPIGCYDNSELDYIEDDMVYIESNMLECEARMACIPMKSELQKLFDEFRFKGFEGTLHELKQRLGVVSSANRRRDMLLVLVSKSGGRADSVRTLLQLALKLRNEPVHERAAIVRSLVKRSSAWRLPQDVWDAMLEYAHGLGLDGTKPEADCREGLHAVMLRQLIATGDCAPAVRAAFLKDFTNFKEYNLVASERSKVCTSVQRILVTAATDVEPEVAARYLHKLLDMLDMYHISLKSSPVVSAILTLAERHAKVARPLLERLYMARVGRRKLLRQYLQFRQDNAALLNALRHDPDAITSELVVKLLSGGARQVNQFILKLAVYFNEAGGIGTQLRKLLQAKVGLEPNVKFVKPLATLAGSDITSIWRELDEAGGEHHKLAAALRANMHRLRPAPDALSLGWRKVGMKAIAWRAMRCPPCQVTELAQTLLEERSKRTVRLALALAPRTECAVDIFTKAAKIRPLAALRAALLYFRSAGDTADLRIWDIVKPVISSADLTFCQGVRHILKKVDRVPKALKPDYCAILYIALDKKHDSVLIELMQYLPEISDDLLEKVLLRWLENMNKVEPESYPALVIWYLMLSSNDNELNTRIEKIGGPFLAKLDAIRNKENSTQTQHFLSHNIDQIMGSLKYNSAFFNTKYQCCILVIEKILIWMQSFMSKEKYFEQYVKILATILYYKAVRQSIEERPEVFEDPVKKMCDGVEIVGFTFGRFIVKELVELKSKYFDSIIELYRNAFVEYLQENFLCGSMYEFAAYISKGILRESDGPEGRLAIEVLRRYEYCSNTSVNEVIRDLKLKCQDHEMKFFLHAELFA